MLHVVAGTWGQVLLLEYVFLEVVTVLRARRGAASAIAVADQLLGASEVEFVACSEIFVDALETFRTETAALSFTDAALVAVARQHKEGRVATFDTDFRGIAGIIVVPA